MAIHSTSATDERRGISQAGPAELMRALGGAAILIADFLFTGYLVLPIYQASGLGSVAASIIVSVIRVGIAAAGLLLAARRSKLSLPAIGIIVASVLLGYALPGYTLYSSAGIIGPAMLAPLWPALYVTAWLMTRGRDPRSYFAVAAVVVIHFVLALGSSVVDNGYSIAQLRGFPPYLVYVEALELVGAAWLGFLLDSGRKAFAPAVPSQSSEGFYTPQTNGMAIASLMVVFFSSLVGMILGYVALSQIKRSGEAGRGLALAAVIIGWFATGLAIVVVIFYVVMFSTAAHYRY